jgi:hypothetical protein
MGMQGSNLIESLRATPTGEHVALHGHQWKVEENSLFLNRTGKVVLLDTVEIGGKVMQEYRQIIELRASQTNQGKFTYTHTHKSNLTRWGFFTLSSSFLAGMAILIGLTVSQE